MLIIIKDIFLFECTFHMHFFIGYYKHKLHYILSKYDNVKLKLQYIRSTTVECESHVSLLLHTAVMHYKVYLFLTFLNILKYLSEHCFVACVCVVGGFYFI